MKRNELLKISLISVGLLLLSLGVLYSIGSQDIHEKKLENQANVMPWGFPLKGTFNFDIKLEEKSFSYSLNKFYMRELPAKKSDQHFIMAGGSNTFGQNLSVQKTLSARLSKTNKFKNYDHYIVASPGWGPSNVLAYMQEGPFKEFVKEEQGTFVFNFIRPHFHRVCGLDQSLYWSKGVLPKYEFEKSELKYRGLYRNAPEFHSFLVRTGIYKILFNFVSKKSKVLDRKVDSKCIELTAEVFKEMKKSYLETYKNGRFIVSLFPTMKEASKDGMKELFSLLRKNDIEVIDFKNDPSHYGKEYFFSDAHVNELSNAKHVELLLKRL
ncbi:hypothetical protein A9Q84_09495 [Halobacteriovorax marinus]|uniref:Uncharacterized protein n=1 Tax=Halobacteriovorax marinus TaxID=97084 RepID=A0A1Y5F6P7_9BACT|nr:hypothetical protein A9Q84_09495 [Halobacteriovorax marinus]